jgi:hypothetical protein
MPVGLTNDWQTEVVCLLLHPALRPCIKARGDVRLMLVVQNVQCGRMLTAYTTDLDSLPLLLPVVAAV